MFQSSLFAVILVFCVKSLKIGERQENVEEDCEDKDIVENMLVLLKLRQSLICNVL